MGKGACRQTLVIRLLLGQTPFNKLALKIRKLGLEQAPVAGDKVRKQAMFSSIIVVVL
jgi:hypothetical protein